MKSVYYPGMPVSISAYRIFIASPNGLQEERKFFRQAVEEFNEYSALPRAVLFQPVGWEDTMGGVGRPQEIINNDLKTCDYFLMILWDRWGSRPDKSEKISFSSGTEEEFYIANECLNSNKYPMRQLVVIFKAVDTRQLSDPGEELKKVVTFRKDLESKKEHLYHTFDDLQKFKDILLKFLNRWLMDHEQQSGNKRRETHTPKYALGLVPKEEALEGTTHEPVSKIVARAQQLADQGLLVDAESIFAQAIENGNDPRALQAYAEFLFRLGRLTQSQSILERLLSIYGSLDPKWKASTYGNLGRIFERKNLFGDAEKAFRSALEIADELDIPIIRANQLRNLGILMSQRGELKQAEIFLQEALSIYQRLQQPLGTAATHNMLGEVYRKRGNFDQAEKHYQESLTLHRGLKNQEGVASALNNLSLVYRHRGELKSAEQALLESLAINEKIHHTESIALNKRNLGEIYEVKGDFESAKREYQTALELYTTLELPLRLDEIKSKISTLQERVLASSQKA